MEVKTSDNLKKLPPYLFMEIDKAKRKAREDGRDLIDLGIGDPDTPTPKPIIQALAKAAKDPANHRYALDAGMPQLRRKIADWYEDRFKVKLDPGNEILPLLGSKEGLAHMAFAFLDKDDVSLVPDPGYPVYNNATLLAGGRPMAMPLLEKNGFLPDLGKIPAMVLKKAKLMFLNYPNNPTAATADRGFLKELLAFSRKYGILVCYDMAYSEMCFDGYVPESLLQIGGMRDNVIEFHSFSKTFNMTGWRLGWACGAPKALAGLAKIKSNIDSGIFQAVQWAGIEALELHSEICPQLNRMYQQRRDVLVDGLRELGWNVTSPKATFYVWTKVPAAIGSIEFCDRLLKRADIVATPGLGFGKYGEGYVRFALTQDKVRLEEAVRRISERL